MAKGERLVGPLGCLAAIVAVLGTLALSVVLFYIAAFEGAPVHGAGPDDVAAANRLFYAVFCCLAAAGLLALACFGYWPERLLPAAAAAYALAAALCGLAAPAAKDAWALGLVCVLLALLTPWWRLGAGITVAVVVMLGAVSAPLLRLWWEAADTSEWVCQPVPAAVVARIESGMTHPGEQLRGAQAARLVAVPGRWVVAADVQGADRYQGNHDMGVWLVVEGDDPPDGQVQPADAIFAVNYVADLGTNFPYAARAGVEQQSDKDAVRRAVDCAAAAVGDA